MVRFSFARCIESCNPARHKFLWQGFCPDGNIVMMPVRPLHADAIHRVAEPGDLPGNCPGQEVEGDFPLCHGFALRHPVPASVSRARSSPPFRTISRWIPSVSFCFLQVESILSLPWGHPGHGKIPVKTYENDHLPAGRPGSTSSSQTANPFFRYGTTPLAVHEGKFLHAIYNGSNAAVYWMKNEINLCCSRLFLLPL
jgi:hypothetical protein